MVTLIGICGRSASGKTTLVEEMKKIHPDYLFIPQDNFFKKEATNWDTLDALRTPEFIDALKKLKHGEEVYIPSSPWTEIFDKKVSPTKVIIVEGFMLFSTEEMANLFDKKIFINVPDTVMMYRRLKRKGTIEEIDYIMNVVIPESKKHNETHLNNADIIINGTLPKETVLKEVESYIGEFNE